MTTPVLSLRAARNLHLAAQGLLRKPRARPRPESVAETLSYLSLLQIDTINIVARSPYLVLYSRLGCYQPQWLDEALARGELIEYWAHEACFLPKQDYPLIRHRMLNPQAMGWKYNQQWMDKHASEIHALLSHIEQHGPVRSADFKTPVAGAKSSGWWDWKPHKKHLEGLFTAGKVMVVARHNFQRVYDLAGKVMPDWDDASHLPDLAEVERQMLENSARSLGIFRLEWLADYYRLKQATIKSRLAEWLEQGSVQPVQVETLGEMWLHRSLLALLPSAGDDKLNATHSTVLSPFDPVVWDRKRAEALFNFSYRLECYTPAPQRQYGYFVLPLLHKGRLVGRMDAKMHRQRAVLEVISLHAEKDVRITATLLNDLKQALTEFARWQSAKQIYLTTLPEKFRAAWGTCWDVSR